MQETMAATKDIKNAVFAGDSVYDFMHGTLDRWEADPYSSQLRPLLRFVDGDHVDSLTPVGKSDLEATLLFIILAGKACAVDPKALLTTDSSNRALHHIVLDMFSWVQSQFSHPGNPFLSQKKTYLNSISRSRAPLEAALQQDSCYIETQSLYVAALNALIGVARTALDCNQRWAGPDIRELAHVHALTKSATIAAFAPAWNEPATVISYEPNVEALIRHGGSGVALSYVLRFVAGKDDIWTVRYCCQQIKASQQQSGLISAGRSAPIWLGEQLSCARIMRPAFPEVADRIEKAVAGLTETSPHAYVEADGLKLSRELSSWTLQALLSLK
ncbi:MAG: hypothetical protein P8N13_09495 [Ilumatobacter sp.]|nr:hypothetical protein [Ilumatobacter sp.]